MHYKRLEVKGKMKKKIFAIMMATLMSAAMLAGIVAVNAGQYDTDTYTVASFSTGTESYDETLAFDEISEEMFIDLIEVETGIEDLTLIYNGEMKNGFDVLLVPSSGEERYIEAVVSEDDVTITELQLENVVTEYVEEKVICDSDCCPIDENIDQCLVTVLTVVGGEATSGTLPMTTGGFKVYTRSAYIAGHNIFGMTLWKNTAKGRFYSFNNKIISISDMSTLWTAWLWEKEYHYHHKQYGSNNVWGLVHSDAEVKCTLDYNYRCESWVWVQCWGDGSWTHDEWGRCYHL